MKKLMIQQWSLGRVVREMEGRLVSASIDPEAAAGVSTDTRTLRPGELFVALRGERFDGHEFVDDAVDAGACAVVVEDASVADDHQVPAIVVDDCLDALGRLGHAIFRAARQQGMHSVAVTGSNGKTTTKELLRAIWGTDGTVWATPGNLNNHIGVPLTLCAIPVGCDHLIVEMGANHRGEIADLIRLAPTDQRIVTSIGRAHLEGFGSMTGVRKAKSEVFEAAGRGTTAIMPHSERQALAPREFPGHMVTFGTDEAADICMESSQVIESEQQVVMEVVLRAGRKRRSLQLPLLGEHNAVNLAAAVATVVTGPISLENEALDQALRSVELPGGRFRILTIGGLRIMDDAYNANPSSMRASFRAFETWCDSVEKGTRVALIGDMHELGDSAGRDHRRLAQWLADRRRLTAIGFLGEFADVMADEAEQGRIDTVEVFDEHRQAARWLAEHQGARVFLKGSRANHLEQVVDELESVLH